MQIRARATSILVLLALCCRTAVADEVVVVVSAKSPLRTLSKSQVADIFLARTRIFPDGRRAEPLDLPEGSDPHEVFYAQYTGRTAAQLKAHWSKIIFTGRGQPPRQFPDVGQITRALQDNPDAIGYLPSDAVGAGLRIVPTL